MTDEEIETRGPGPWADAEETETETVANPLAEVNPYANLLGEAVEEDAEKRHVARIRASVRLLRETDDTRLDDIGKTALFRSVASGIAGLHVHNPSEIFGRRATADIGGNIELLRRLTRGEWDLLDDPDVAEWRKVRAEGDEAAAKYANEKMSDWTGGSPADFGDFAGRIPELAGAGMPGAQFGNVMQNMEAPGRDDAIRRSAGYDALTDEEKAKWRRERIDAYERKLARGGSPVGWFMRMTGGLDDNAKSMVERAWRTGELKREELERYGEKDQKRILGAVSMMRGDRKEGTLLFVPGTDISEDGWKVNLYAAQQSFLDIFKNLGKSVGDVYGWARLKTLSGAEREEAKRRIDLDAQIEAALEQPLVEPEGFGGAMARGLAENAWFIPVGWVGATGKGMMLASQGLKAEKGLKGIVQGVKAGLTPLRAGRVAKSAAKEAEAAVEAAKASRAAALSKGVKALGEGKIDFEVSQMALRRQMAAMARYTEALRAAEQTAAEAARRVPARIAQWWGGRAVKSAADAAMFSSFFREHVEAADAAGVGREESVPIGLLAGAINAVVEHLHMPGQEDNIAAAELKYLMGGCSREAWKKAGKEGFRKWAGRFASRYLSQTAKVTAEEGFVEEPIQQLVNEMGIAVGKRADELRKEGQGGMADALNDLWARATVDGMAAKTLQIFTDAAWDALPGSLGFGLISLPHMMVRQKARNVWYGRDEGLADGVQRAINARTATEEYWNGRGKDIAPDAKNPHRFQEAMTAARRAFRAPQGDVVREVADAAGVDVKTAEVLTDYLRMEAELSVVSPRFSAFRDLNMSLADIGEDTIRTLLPGYVEGSFASDPENGVYSGRVKLGDGTERTIAYRVGDWSQIAADYLESASAKDSELAASWNSRETGTKWEDLDDTTRRAYALSVANGLSTGKSGVFELTDSKGGTVRVNADDVILLANGRLADIGYGAAATQGTVRHETFHSLWRFVRKTMKDEDVQNLAKTFGIDVTKEGWERELDETMAPQMERYASGHYVAHAVSEKFDRLMNGWAGKFLGYVAKLGPQDEVTDPDTGEPYQLKGLYDAILRGELGSGTLGVELRKVKSGGVNSPTPNSSKMPIEVTDADRAEAESETRAEAAETEPPAPAAPAQPAPATAPVQAATAENPADAATPNQRYYKVGLPNSPVKLVGRLEVRDVDTGIITSTDADYHDRGNQNRDDKSEESRALVEKIGANPDPLQIGTVQPIASNGIIWMLPNGDVIIGNHRVNGVRLGYAKGTTAELEKFVREDAARRGIEIGEDVKKPLMVFVLERIESPDGKADVHEVVRLANESQNRGFNIREQASNDAKILADNNLLPRMEFRADGRIDETKSGDAIGKFRQESGAQGLIAEDGSLTEEGQTRIQNAALAVLLGGEGSSRQSQGGGGNNALLNKIMTNAGRLDMQSELRALMKMTPELMALSEAKPAYDLRAPLAEALQLFTEWRDKDETARVEKGKTRHDWRETRLRQGSGGQAAKVERVRGLSWEAFMSQGDMFRAPSDEAKILGDMFAKAESLRSFDREDVESEAGKKRVIDLISDYLADYIANARAVNTETDDMFGGTPASRADVLAAQRATGGEGGGARFSISAEEAQRQYDDVVARYTNEDGSKKRGWMKAPNGRPTLLDERQWVLVRTPAFKEWFGDWESDAELAPSDMAGAKSSFRVLMSQNAEIRTADGATLRFVSQSAKAYSKEAEQESSSKAAHWAALANIEGLVARSRFMFEEKPRNGSPDIEAYVKYGTVFTFGGEKYLAKITSKRYAGRDAQNFYSVESVSVEKIDARGIHEAIAKGQPLDASDVDRISNILAGVNGEDAIFKNSKIVDENGEPLVVYHGTPHGDFTVFEKSRIGSTTNRQNVKVGELGFYFTNDRGAAQNYAEYLGSDSDPRTMAVYLSLKNPLVVKDSGWGSAADQADARKKDLARWAQEGGHDGIIVQSTDEILENGMPDTVYIAFEPTWIKSATDNTGAFSENPDVRFSVDVGDDLADNARFADFKAAMTQAQPIPDGVSLLPHDVSPKDALDYYDQNILGKTFTFPDGSTITMNPGHFFRLTCEGRRNKDGVRKGHVGGYADSASALEGIRKGDVAADRIYGWQSDRAGVMPLFGDLVEHPMFILQDKNTPEKTQNVKRYDLGDGRSIVAIFRVIDNGQRIISFSGFTPKRNRMKQYRVIYADDAISAGTSPARLADGQTAQAADSISQSGAPAQGGSPDVRTAFGRSRYSIGGIYTGTAADYANRSRQGGVDDGPSLLKIGTGEGSQVYGWGLYGSTVRGVAEGYAGRRKQSQDLMYKGRDIAPVFKFPRNATPEELALKFARMSSSVDGLLSNLEYEGRKDKSYKPQYDAAVEWVKNHRSDFTERPRGNNLYEQTFFTDRAPGDESHLLKWYEPVSEEQLKWIRDALVKEKNIRDYSKTGYGNVLVAFEHYLNVYSLEGDTRGITGETVYKAIDNVVDKDPQAASEFLARAGIDGVKYPVDSYGGKGVKDGDKAGWNYVSFRDDNIRVDHKWTDGQLRYSVSKELTDAMRKREAMQSILVEGKVQPWSENFPKVMLQTTLANIRQKWPELHQRAKAGSDGAALELVRNILGEERVGNKANPKWEKLRALAAEHPRAIVSYVHAEEATGRNKIPAAYAHLISMITGLRLTNKIVQTVRAHHTGANAVERMTRRAAFDGPVMRGAEYILVDDHVTQGGTLNELRKYIQSHGGKIVAAVIPKVE